MDVALLGLERALAEGSVRPFTWGNITLLRLNGGVVDARYDFDEENVEGQFVEAHVLQQMLQDWRQRIEQSASASTAPLPEMYRRNPTSELRV